ncbi:M14 family metallocarboxypeptidase [Shewanella sp. UCD-KL12]|uniref:M14 family metallopeptidase n=1 Tax=Shewanella sp. UCD-KL12 TaxID=1917163 RepID=UPI0009708DE9|nr:M14 family metallocarboxypeptidase [Shewanella sp. UCD-KL12]
MDKQNSYSIGTRGQKWGEAEKAQWLKVQTIKRSYQQEVVAKILPLSDRFQVDQYGSLSYNPSEYPLFVVKSKQWSEDKPTVLVTGGVHGYETSGVQGAIRFLETAAQAYLDRFNLVVAPCISPWGYETINRWNPNAVDPNRSFYQDSPAEESAAIMAYIAGLGVDITAHIDLHETTDTDNSEFRPALAARDAVEHTNWNIPDGFYLVGNTELPADAFQTAIIKSVEQVTHIAPADDAGKLIGVELSQFGVINYPTKALGLCIGFSDSVYATTTEVYPDSPQVDDENCILAQVAAITAGLDYILPLD